MPLRLLDLTIPTDQVPSVREMLTELAPEASCEEMAGHGRTTFRILMDSGASGALIDRIDHRFGHEVGFRLLLIPVEAALPRPEEPAKENDKTTAASETPNDSSTPATPARAGISREELYDDVEGLARVTWVYLATIVLSTIVAATGLLRDSVAIIIGAMVIAPLLGPNVALALATTLGDLDLLRRAVWANVVGFTLAVALSVTFGLLLPVDPAGAEVASRTIVELSDVAVALAAGAAGVLALTSGLPTALVGVMVAVALLPPTVVFGALLGAGEWSASLGALLLVATNVICVNLAGTLTLWLQGIRPRTWLEQDKARRATRIAVGIWIVLLATLVLLITFAAESLASS